MISIPATPGTMDSRGSESQIKTLSLPWNFKPPLPSNHFKLFVLEDEQSREGDTILLEIFDPDYQREVGLLLHQEAERRWQLSMVAFLGTALINLKSKWKVTAISCTRDSDLIWTSVSPKLAEMLENYTLHFYII